MELTTHLVYNFGMVVQKKEKMDLIFIHGGPGLNSNPEQMALSEFLKQNQIEAFFWNEPSNLRPNGEKFIVENAYKNILKSIHASVLKYQPKILVGLSFGAQACIDYLLSYDYDPELEVLFISPCLDLFEANCKIMRLSQEDFQLSAPEKAKRIESYLKKTQELWDADMKNGHSLAWENPKLAQKYFIDQKVLEHWAQAMSSPGYQPDAASADAVIKDFKEFQTPHKKIKKQAHLLLGSQDPIWHPKKNMQKLESVFENVKTIELKAGHFPHLEHQEEFKNLIKQIVS